MTPSGGISSTTLHECIKELDSEKANLISPILTGAPLAPTPASGSSGTPIANTEFISKYFANLISPTFTGTPRAPTPITGDNSTRIATTEFIATKLTSFAQLDSPVFTGSPSLPSGTSGIKTINGSSLLGTGDVVLSISGGNFAPQSGNSFLAAPTGASGVPSFRAIADSDLTAVNMGNRNLLINGSFVINQTLSTSVADVAYHLDQWYALTETGNVTIAQQTNQENGQPTSLRMTQPDVTAKRMGSAQPIESLNCRHLRGQQVSLRSRIRCSVSQAIRWAIIEWTGTADTITKDVVNSWTNGTFTTGNFFISTTTTIAGTGSVTPAANTWADLLASVTISSSANNLIAFIWSEGTLAQNATLDLGLVQLVGGAQGPFGVRPISFELNSAKRYYDKSFPLSVAPAQNAGRTGAIETMAIRAATATGISSWFRFSVPMRVTPSMTFYNPSAANGQARNIDLSTDCTSTGSDGLTDSSSKISYVLPASTVSTNLISIHWEASARL